MVVGVLVIRVDDPPLIKVLKISFSLVFSRDLTTAFCVGLVSYNI